MISLQERSLIYAIIYHEYVGWNTLMKGLFPFVKGGKRKGIIIFKVILPFLWVEVEAG